MHIDKKKTQIAILAVLGCALIGSAAFQFFPQQKTAPQRPVKKIAPETPPVSKPASPRPSGKDGVSVPPITDLDPRTVYSGNLGTLTGIQAGADLKKMELEFAQLDAKIRELQQPKEAIPTAPITLPQLSPSAGVPGLPEKKESTRIVVMAVRGINENLIATLRTKDGTHVVKTGDTVPGFGKVQSIARDRVVINGSAIPWM